ncbi:MAG TPA: hypothetical protein VF105_02340 [Gemmatimonadaceae bacterium]
MNRFSERSGAALARRWAIATLFVSIIAIAISYGAAFSESGTPTWSPWLIAIAVPISLVAIMILGAARGAGGIGRLTVPFALVALTLIIGFTAALALPATEGPMSRLWLGLPLRAAIVIYGIGLLPIFVLPVAYALTFETQTLSAQDVARVRELGLANANRLEMPDASDGRTDE